MNRRQFVAATGSIAIGGLAGCLGGDGYETESFRGTSVPLAPLADVAEWYEDGDAHFVDTRSQEEFDELRIEGSVFSPAEDGLDEDDPAEDWAADETIVTYCVCPHTLAGLRAGSLIDDGYDEVYALDEGFQAWIDEEYPIAGETVSGSLPAYEVSGRTDSAYAGEYVWVREPDTGQREPGEIEPDGSYELTLHFVGVDDDTPLVLETPSETAELTLAELTTDVVRV